MKRTETVAGFHYELENGRRFETFSSEWFLDSLVEDPLSPGVHFWACGRDWQPDHDSIQGPFEDFEEAEEALREEVAT